MNRAPAFLPRRLVPNGLRLVGDRQPDGRPLPIRMGSTQTDRDNPPRKAYGRGLVSVIPANAGIQFLSQLPADLGSEICREFQVGPRRRKAMDTKRESVEVIDEQGNAATLWRVRYFSRKQHSDSSQTVREIRSELLTEDGEQVNVSGSGYQAVRSRRRFIHRA